GCNPVATIQPTCASVTANITASDNCTGSPTINCQQADSDSGCIHTRKFTITATDACNNVSDPCVVTYTWKVDHTLPTFTSCPPDKQLACGESTEPSHTGTATATDNCPAAIAITYSDVATAANCTGRQGVDRTWKAVDHCGNISTCVQHITFLDNTAPTLQNC